MESSSIAEQRATAVAKLKRAASLPRMKDGRRPPMHVEAVSEGERVDCVDKPEEESAQESDGGKGRSAEASVAGDMDPEREPESMQQEAQERTTPSVVEDAQEREPSEKTEETQQSEVPSERPTTPGRKRRSRSRARSRGSKDLRTKAKTPPPANNESSADEYAIEDPPPSPPLISPIPSHGPFLGFSAAHLLNPPLSPGPSGAGPGLFYPGATPSTPAPMLPSLDQLQKGIGLFRSNSVGAARMMAMQKLTRGSEPLDMTFATAPSTPLGRNNTVAGGERIAARANLLRRLGERMEKAEVDQTSGGEDIARPVTPGSAKRRRRRSKRSLSRASAVLDDRDERDKEPPSTSPTTPVGSPSPLPPPFNIQRNIQRKPPEAARVPVQQIISIESEIPPPMGGRGVVIEDEDEDTERRPAHNVYSLPTTPARRHGARLPLTPDAPSATSADLASTGVPAPFSTPSRTRAYKHDLLLPSPFATPLREKPLGDEDEESDAYRELRSRAPTRNTFNRDSEISWVADPVPMSRMPINDDDDDDDEEVEVEGLEEEHEQPEPEPEPELEHEPQPELDTEPEPEPGQHEIRQEEQEEASTPVTEDPPQPFYPASVGTSAASKELLVEIETSPEMLPSHIPPSPSSIMALSPPSGIEPSVSTRPSPRVYPMRLSVATPVPQSERSPSTTGFPDWDENRPEANTKRGGDGVAGTWDRIKNVLSRSNSNGGRRSRTNSIGTRDRRYNTDSSVSRESGASLTSTKPDKGERSSIVAQQGPHALMQSPSASASILSLSPQAVPHTPMSPIPPASSADLLKYADSKLFPFPGMKQLEDKRNKAKGISSASSPDIVLSPNGIEAIPSTSSASSATTKSPEVLRERKLSHQASDTRLLPKFANLASISPIAMAPSSSSNADYFSMNSATTTSTGSLSSALNKLPTNREGVRKWLSAKKIFSSQHSTPSTPSPPAVDTKARSPSKKPSLSDLLSSSRKDTDLSDWEDIGHEKSRTPTSANSPSALGKHFFRDEPKLIEVRVDVTQSIKHDQLTQTAQSPRVFQTNHVTEFSPLSSPPEPPSSTTPDPQSSLDEYPAISTSNSQSSSSLAGSPGMRTNDSGRAAVILSRLDEALGRGSKSSIWPIAIDDPPRKLVLSSPVLQVSNANTVKDRFMFLFNDLLVIAKPIILDQDVFDTSKPTPMDRKFSVKSVVPLRDVKFSAERDESRTKVPSSSHMRHPVIRSFVHQFSKDPDQAIAMLFEKAHCRDDPIALGQLIFLTTDLDRTRLGEYLSRRTSKHVLKAYVDSFGFNGMRIDKALRVFLLSICIPPKASLDYLLEAFASRWFEANIGVVAYDKDTAINLVRAIVQLNEVMHGGIAQTTGMTGYPKHNVISRDFVQAFRRQNAHCLVSDDLLDKVYAAIRRERLSQARRSTGEPNENDVVITMKRPIPTRLTYRIQSEPIILRISQTDPHFTIQLFGQDLVFEPSELSFAKSPEASFRITGTSLGPKTIIMRRSGANALAYSGLPLSTPVVVERAFMRNTFQLAFLNHEGEKRKYMFSIDDYLKCHHWSASLKQHIDAAHTPSAPAMAPVGSKFKSHKAVEDIALRVLQDTLINSEGDFSFPSAVDYALARLNGTAASPNSSPNGTYSYSKGKRRSRGDATITHIRSKSRSQFYHRHGAGQMEPDADDESGDDGLLRRDISTSQRSDERVWSGHDLEIVCRQNSSLPSVLAYLSVEAHDEIIVS